MKMTWMYFNVAVWQLNVAVFDYFLCFKIFCCLFRHFMANKVQCLICLYTAKSWTQSWWLSHRPTFRFSMYRLQLQFC